MTTCNPDIHHRKSIRLKGYDYSQSGAYLVTICTQNREMLLDPHPVCEMVQKWWNKLPEKFPSIEIDEFVTMPNHVHGIIPIVLVGADLRVCPGEEQSQSGEHTGSPLQRKPTVGRIVQWFKTMTTNEYLRQHIIRNDHELDQIWDYIANNILQGENDENNIRNVGADLRVCTGEGLEG